LEKIVCKDHTVTSEKFELIFDSSLELYYTNPQPSKQSLPLYYKSEFYISHTDANISLFDRVYQEVKKYTIGKKVALLESFENKTTDLLDVGCGTGDFLNVASERGWAISGVEPNRQARKLAIKKLRDCDTIVADLEELLDATQPKKYDVITLWHVLEHVPNYDTYIDKLKSLLKKDGHLLVAVPNYKSFDAQHYKEFWAAYDVPRHLWHFSQDAIRKIFAKHQIHLERIIPMYFDSYYVSLLSEKHKTGKSNIFKAFWLGFLSNWKARKSSEYSSLIYILKKSKIAI